MKQLIVPFIACLLLAACNSRTPEQDGPAAAPSPQAAQPAATGDASAAPAAATTEAAAPVPKGLPFVGKRIFETRPAVTGTGTPHRFVEILANGDVFFEYGQQNPGTGTTMDGERYYAGKFTRVLKCVFGKLDDTRYYIVGKAAIVEVDESGNRLSSEDCCGNGNVDMVTKCPCEGSLYDPGTAQ